MAIRPNFRYAQEVVLLYEDNEGNLYEQPLTDLVEVGTLIDPESGEDLQVVGIDLVKGSF